MKWLIGLLTAATGILHLLIGFGVLGGGSDTNWLLVLNGAGYLVLLFLYWTSAGSRRGTIRWILLAYTLITFVGYFLLNGMGGLQFTLGVIVKVIELLLIILLFLDRGSDRVAVATPTPAPRAGAKISSEAYQAASGAGVASSAAALGAIGALDRTEAEAAAAAERRTTDLSAWGDVPTSAESAAADVAAAIARAEADTADWGEEVVDNMATGASGSLTVAEMDAAMTPPAAPVVDVEVTEPDWVDRAGDRMGEALDTAGAAMAGAAAWVGDKVDDMGDATREAVDDTGDALAGAGDWVGDKVDDLGDAMGEAVDDTGDALSDAGDWVGDKVDDMGDATREAVDDTGDALGDAGDWVGDKVDDLGDAMGEAVDDTGDALSDAGDWVGDRAEDAGDMAGAAVDTTGAALGAAGAAVGAAVGSIVDESQARMDVAAPAGAEPTAAELRTELEAYIRSFGSGSEFHKAIEYIEGIGPAYGAQLRGVGVATVLDLMVEGATRLGRKHLAERSGLSASQILTWVNHIDLYRIKGVAQEYADLLEQSGVDTVVELAQRNPNNLFKRMNDINEQKQLVRRTPRLDDVKSWVEQAKNLKRLVHY